jgi:curved DNA-binding protein CbpA
MAPTSEADREKVDIDPQRQREILRLDQGLERMNHFEVLQLLPGASAAEIKEAYHTASLLYHPDRYFQKNVGSYKEKIERIFKRLTEANLVLTDPERRKAYQKANPHLFRAPPRAPSSSESDQPHAPTLHAHDTLRASERRARLARHPYRAKANQRGDLMASARAHVSEGDFGHALTELQLAARTAPGNRELQSMIEDTARQQKAEHTAQEFKRGEAAEARGDAALAVSCYLAATELDRTHAMAAARAATLLHRLGQDADRARDLAQRAVQLEPRNLDHKCLLGMLLMERGETERAEAQFEAVLKIDPNHAAAKKRLKKRWPF